MSRKIISFIGLGASIFALIYSLVVLHNVREMTRQSPEKVAFDKAFDGRAQQIKTIQSNAERTIDSAKHYKQKYTANVDDTVAYKALRYWTDSAIYYNDLATDLINQLIIDRNKVRSH